MYGWHKLRHYGFLQWQKSENEKCWITIKYIYIHTLNNPPFGAVSKKILVEWKIFDSAKSKFEQKFWQNENGPQSTSLGDKFWKGQF